MREKIFAKSNGHCWYCGCDLKGKRWHKDHVEAIYREPEGGSQKPDLDTIDNLVPACIPCNLFKSVFSVEEFRREIEQQAERGRKSSVNFRTAERFGLIEITNNPVTFAFETNKWTAI